MYFDVADFASFKSSLSIVGSNLCAGLLLASLIVSRLDSVPLGSKFGINAVLFFQTKENSLSSSALEWGITRINLAIRESFGKHKDPSGSLILER